VASYSVSDNSRARRTTSSWANTVRGTAGLLRAAFCDWPCGWVWAERGPIPADNAVEARRADTILRRVNDFITFNVLVFVTERANPQPFLSV